MIRVYIPVSKGKNKTNVRGFWRNDKGIIFYDYLKVINTSYIEPKQLEVLKKKYNQEAIAFIDNDVLKIFYSRDKIEVLPNRIYKEVLRANLRQELKEALKLYGGVTIYKEDNKYFKEIFYKQEVYNERY